MYLAKSSIGFIYFVCLCCWKRCIFCSTVIFMLLLMPYWIQECAGQRRLSTACRHMCRRPRHGGPWPPRRSRLTESTRGDAGWINHNYLPNTPIKAVTSLTLRRLSTYPYQLWNEASFSKHRKELSLL